MSNAAGVLRGLVGPPKDPGQSPGGDQGTKPPEARDFTLPMT